MAVKSQRNRIKKGNRLQKILSWRVPRATPALIILALVSVIILPGTARALYHAGAYAVRAVPDITAYLMPGRSTLAPLFTQEVAHWEPQIRKWAKEYDVEPNLLATVMQIESCGHPTVNSYAGAQGLFQVMPFHFASDEDMLDPDTNALRGVSFLKSCLDWANHDIGLALACYNGGPHVLQVDSMYWDQQVRSYYRWGTGIYADALTHKRESETLNQWLAAGGSRLCNMAAAEIAMR